MALFQQRYLLWFEVRFSVLYSDNPHREGYHMVFCGKKKNSINIYMSLTPPSYWYAKRGESTLITTGRRFSLHHSATISYHFDKIFTPNALEMTLLSNDVKGLVMLEVIGCWTWNWQYFLWNFKFDDRKHEIHPILLPRQSLYCINDVASNSDEVKTKKCL